MLGVLAHAGLLSPPLGRGGAMRRAGSGGAMPHAACAQQSTPPPNLHSSGSQPHPAQVLPMNTGVEGGETAVKLARRWGYDVKVSGGAAGAGPGMA